VTSGHAPLALSVGDPAGVGPEIALRAAARFPQERFAVYGDADALERMAARLSVAAARAADATAALEPGIALIDTGRCPEVAIRAHAPSAEVGRAQVAALDHAARDVEGGVARALVTGPTSKEAVSAAGVDFRGQTEHLARAASLSDDAVTMLFLGERLRTGLVTTHHAIREVPALITLARVQRTITHLAEALLALGDDDPELVVAGLNPHAGEGGLFGDEESRVVAPGIAAARGEPPFSEGRARVTGPVGAESAFRWAAGGRVAGVVAMLHDQATIAAKLVDWGTSVNVTWGLPFVRTSVDHGVAYDAARRGDVDADGMVAAIRMAQRLSAARATG